MALQAEGPSDDEIQLQLRRLQTGFRYSVSMGVSYRFRSILNNIVNPRFDGSEAFFSPAPPGRRTRNFTREASVDYR